MCYKKFKKSARETRETHEKKKSNCKARKEGAKAAEEIKRMSEN